MRRPTALALGTLALTLAGCTVFTSIFGQGQSQQAQSQGQPSAAANQQAAEQRREEQARADDALAAETEAARAAALTEDATLDQVLAFADKISTAHESGAVGRGKVAPELSDEAEAALAAHHERAVEAGDAGREDRIAITLAQGRLLAATGRADAAGERWLETLRLGGPAGAFDALAGLPRSPATDAATLEACALVRPAVPDGELPAFVELCLTRANGDGGKLSWKGARRDLAAYEAELERQAEEAAKQAAAEAEAAKKAELYASAAVFAAGRCRFSDCATEGWETDSDEGTIRTTCRFSNCLEDGWDTSFPDGGRATTRCRFSNCLEDGWDTDFPDGSSASTRCRFSNCAEDGWDTELPDGERATTRCRFSKCFEDGWDTDMPDGDSVQCRCRFSNCLEDGTECD